FNALLQDHRLECDLRRFPDPVTPTHLDNEVRAETVDAMMAATARHYGLAQEYFRLKADLLGLPRLKNSDVYAPLGAARVTIPARLRALERPLNSQPPLPLAQTASPCAELVLTRALLAHESSPTVRRELICTKLEDTIAAVFRQNALTRFEMAAHARRRTARL